MSDPPSVYQSVHPEAVGPPFRLDGWSWHEPVRGEHFRRCSFCGSVHPEDLAAETAWTAEWADQKYGWPHKFYVDIPNRHPDALFVVGGASHHRPDGSGWIASGDLTPEQLAIAERDGYRPHDSGYWPAFIRFGTRPMHHAKFYTVHLRDSGLEPTVKLAIERRSGLGFEFADGRVRWYAAGSGAGQ